MKPRWLMLICCALLSFVLLACSLASSATPTAPSGGEQPIGPAATPEATKPPLAPGTESIPTRQPPTATPTLAASATPTATATLTPTATSAPTKIPVSTGPLDFTVNIAGCRLDPSRDGGVILTLRFDATGGNGVYTYYREHQKVQRTFDRPATKGTAAIDAFQVESSDGQKVEQKIRFTGAQFGCP
jgi:hypothetical protein